jgi:hypothetical protein
MGTQIQFPDIKPSARSFTPGNYPETTFESLDGTKTYLRFGNQPINATLSLSFSNLHDTDTANILNSYFNSKADPTNFINLSASTGALAGIDYNPSENSLLQRIGKYNSPLKWRFNNPPTVTSTFDGLSNVSCSFVACLDAPI